MKDFTFEFNNEVQELSNAQEEQLRQDAKTRLQQLNTDHEDIVGAAVSLELLADRETNYLFQARVVVYMRPDNTAAIAKRPDPVGAIGAALDAVERQVRKQRNQLRDKSLKAVASVNESLYELDTDEIYHTYADNELPDVWLEQSRDQIAARLMVDEQLNQDDAYYVADQILVAAQEMISNPDARALG